MVFLSNPPEADKSLRLPCEMRSLFLWGYVQKIILGILTYAGLSRHFHGVAIFFACLDLEQKSSFMDGHYLNA
jgi:hypothetical protein